MVMDVELERLFLCMGVYGKARVVALMSLDGPSCMLTRRLQTEEENFEVGRWYLMEGTRPKRYTPMPIDAIVPTRMISKPEKMQTTTVELTLPVFFAPNLKAINIEHFSHGQLPLFKDGNSPNIPICPLFGLGTKGMEYLPAVDSLDGSLYSNGLYAYKIQLSCKLNALLPFWEPQNVNGTELMPWDYAKYPIVNKLFADSLKRGLVVEQLGTVVVQRQTIHWFVLLNQQAEVVIAAYPTRKSATIGEYRQFWPITLNCYEFPVVLALECPDKDVQDIDQTEVRPELRKKIRNDRFEFAFLCESSQRIAGVKFPWIGKFVEPFDDSFDDLVANGRKVANKTLIRFQASPTWNFAKRSVAWFLQEGIEEVKISEKPQQIASIGVSSKGTVPNGQTTDANSNSSRSSTLPDILSINDTSKTVGVQQQQRGKQPERSGANLEPLTKNRLANLPTPIPLNSNGSIANSSPAFSMFGLSKQNNTRAEPHCTDELIYRENQANCKEEIEEKKTAIASFMTKRQKVSEDPFVFLLWDNVTWKFTRKCYARMRPGLIFNQKIGDWFELDYIDKPQKDTQIIVSDYRPAAKQVVTRVRSGICAQYSTNRERFVNIWHTDLVGTVPCLGDKIGVYEDRGWWPWLCRKCFPDLGDLTPPIRGVNQPMIAAELGQRNKETKSPSSTSSSSELEALANKKSDRYFSSETMEGTEEFVDCSSSLASLSTSKSAKTVLNGNRQHPNLTLAVLFIVRDSGDSIFLIFDEENKKISHQVYAQSPDRIAGNPKVGQWYRIKYQINSEALLDKQRINILSADAKDVRAPVETRLKDNFAAQFKTTCWLIRVWHKPIRHAPDFEIDFKDPWWPKLCPICYPPEDLTNPSKPSAIGTSQNLYIHQKKPVGVQQQQYGKQRTGANLEPLAFNRFDRPMPTPFNDVGYHSRTESRESGTSKDGGEIQANGEANNDLKGGGSGISRLLSRFARTSSSSLQPYSGPVVMEAAEADENTQM